MNALETVFCLLSLQFRVQMAEQCVILGGGYRDRVAELLSVGRKLVDALELGDKRWFGMVDA